MPGTRRAMKITCDTLTITRCVDPALTEPILRGQPVRLTSGGFGQEGLWTPCGPNDERVMGIAMNEAAPGCDLDVVIGDSIIPVIVGAGGATNGMRALIGLDGKIENAATADPAAGATQYIVGQFFEDGVDGDLVGMHFFKYERVGPAPA